MQTRAEILNKIAELQLLLGRYDATPEDVFHFGTIIRIAANNNMTKWHIIKTAEDTWRYLGGNGVERTLAEWILQATDSDLGYFEVYVLEPGSIPIYVNDI